MFIALFDGLLDPCPPLSRVTRPGSIANWSATVSICENPKREPSLLPTEKAQTVSMGHRSLIHLGVVTLQMQNIDKKIIRINESNSVYWQLYKTVITKIEVDNKAKIQVYKAIYMDLGARILWGRQ